MTNLKNLLLVTFVSFSVHGLAQDKNPEALKYAKTINARDISNHLHIIASDEFEGRETGKAGQKKAMEYLINEFKSYGIEDYMGLNYRASFPSNRTAEQRS